MKFFLYRALAHGFCARSLAFSLWLIGMPCAVYGGNAPLDVKALRPMPIESYRGVTEVLEFEVTNLSEKPLKILSVRSRSGEGESISFPASLEPAGKGRIVLKYVLPEALGSGQVNFIVRTDVAGSETMAIRVPYFVQSAIDPEFVVLDFGDVTPGMKVRTSLDLGSRHVEALKFKRVVSKPDWMDVTFAKASDGDAQKQSVVATMTRLPDFGLTSTALVLETNVPEDPSVRIPVVVHAFSHYKVSPFPLTFGGVLEGESKVSTLRFERIGKGDAKLARIDSGNDPSLTMKSTSCGTGCIDVAVTFDSMRARGGMKNPVTFHFEDDDVPLVVPMDALVVGPNVKITDLGDLGKITVKSKTTVLKKP